MLFGTLSIHWMGYFVAKQAHHTKDGRLPWKSLLWMWRLWSPLYLHSGYTSQNGQRRKWWQSIGFYGYLRQNLPVPLTKPYRCTNLSVLYPSPCISAWSCKASPGVWLWSDLPPKTLVNLVTSPTSLFTQKKPRKKPCPGVLGAQRVPATWFASAWCPPTPWRGDSWRPACPRMPSCAYSAPWAGKKSCRISRPFESPTADFWW